MLYRTSVALEGKKKRFGQYNILCAFDGQTHIGALHYIDELSQIAMNYPR